MGLARWPSLPLKNGMVTLWAAFPREPLFAARVRVLATALCSGVAGSARAAASSVGGGASVQRDRVGRV